MCVEEIDVIGSSSQDASTDSDADEADDPVLSANKAFTMSLRLSRPLWWDLVCHLLADELSDLCAHVHNILRHTHHVDIMCDTESLI